MRFKGPYHVFNSMGVWIGFCVGPNLFNTDGVWCGWFPWEGSYDAVKTDGSYLGTVLGSRFYRIDDNQHLRVRKYLVYPGIPPLPTRPACVAPRELIDGASDVNLKCSMAVPLPATASSVQRVKNGAAQGLRSC